MDEDHFLLLGKNYVGFAVQLLSVQPESVAQPVQQHTNGEFRARVLGRNP
jgi:hypothetical protein